MQDIRAATRKRRGLVMGRTLRLGSLREGISDPAAAAAFIFGGKLAVKRHWTRGVLSLLLDPSPTLSKRVTVFLKELDTKDRISELWNATSREGHAGYGQLPDLELMLLYALCRLLTPRVVVETGVSSGVSSAYILQALEDNSQGVLHSIDMPDYDRVWWSESPITALPEGKESGWAIPSSLRKRWELHPGKSSDVLPGLLQSLGPIDIFLHDSEHTPENMAFEYRQAYQHLQKGGIIMSDDIVLALGGFESFARDVGERPVTARFMRAGLLRRTT